MTSPTPTPTDTLCPAWLSSWAQRHQRLAACYLQADPRSLGLARIYIGLVLLVDLVHRWAAETQHSIFFAASTTTRASLLFALCACVYFVFTIGYRTKLFHGLSLVALVSLQGRNVFVEFGSEVTLTLLCAFAFFLPLGIRFSVDSLSAGLRKHKELRPEALADRASFAGRSTPITSLAVVAIIMQLTTIYIFDMVHKSGLTGHEGSEFPSFVTWTALAVQAALVLCLASPWHWKQSRRVALLLAMGFHAGIAVFLNLGMFSFYMLGFFCVLITDEDWRLLARWFGPSPKRARVVYFDAGCGVCFALARCLARMDLFGLLILRANDSEDRPTNLPSELIERTIVVDDPVSGGRWTETAAFGQIFKALPGMAPLGWLLVFAPMRIASNPFYKLFSRNRARVSVMLGMAACGVPGSKGVDPKPEARRTPQQLLVAPQMNSVRELTVVGLLFVQACVLYARLLAG